MSETPADPEQNPTDQREDQDQPKDASPEGFPFDPNQDPPREEPAVPSPGQPRTAHRPGWRT
jgi:hypothetical protein